MDERTSASIDNGGQNAVPVAAGLFDYPVEKIGLPMLLGAACKKCGRRFFPKRKLCPTCFDQGEMEEVTIDRQGVIYACTVVHIPSPSGVKAPYAYGYVDIPADGIRVFALFSGDDPFSFHTGQKVALVLEPIYKNGEGQDVIAYKFKPAEEGRKR